MGQVVSGLRVGLALAWGMVPQLALADLGTAQLQFVFNMRSLAPDDFQGSFFYLNDSINPDGNLVAGQIGWGVWEIDKAGNAVHMLRTNQDLALGNDPATTGNPPIGAKSVARIGNSYFVGTNSHAGVARFPRVGPDAWDLDGLTDLVNIPGGIESVATDGVRLFTNESTNANAGAASGGRDTVHGFTITSGPAVPFVLAAPAWVTDIGPRPDRVNPNPRFRGLAYGGNGFVYGMDTGDGGSGSIWAFDRLSGAATKVTDYGDPAGPDTINFLGEVNSGFGVIVHHGQLYVVGSGGYLTAFDLTTPTTVSNRRDFNFAQMLFDSGAAESPQVALFGAAADGDGPDGDHDFLWLSYESLGERPNRRIAGFSFEFPPFSSTAPHTPEPSSALLLAAGIAVMLRRHNPTH